ncbi:MAG: 30S ribosomal protein S17 [Anaerolineae bacterium]|nr:30S ribosomal protein S17 [Anaerolineae bacterium]
MWRAKMPNKRRRLSGTVVSNKMDKTVVVQIESRFRHPLYGKVVSSAQRFKAHDEGNACQIGDSVIIVESRPLSRTKRWVVEQIIGQDLSAQVEKVDELSEAPSDATVASNPTTAS